MTVDFDTRNVRLNIQDGNSSLNKTSDEEETKKGVFQPDIETQKILQAESIYYPGGIPKLTEGRVERELTETDLVLL